MSGFINSPHRLRDKLSVDFFRTFREKHDNLQFMFYTKIKKKLKQISFSFNVKKKRSAQHKPSCTSLSVNCGAIIIPEIRRFHCEVI